MKYISQINGRSGKEYIDEILEDEGPLLDAIRVDENTVQEWTGVLPDVLIDFWRHHGIGALQGGLMRLCLPQDFNGLLSQIFQADPDFSHKDCHVVGYGPFGNLMVWSQRHWLCEVDFVHARLDAPRLLDPAKKLNANTPIVASLLGHPPDSLDAYDEDGKKLFARAVRKLGRPGPGQAFGFVPALAMGGAPTLKNIRIVPALEHFLFLAQLQQFDLVDYLSTPPRVVRMIG